GQGVDLYFEHLNARSEFGQSLHAGRNHLTHRLGHLFHHHFVEARTRWITHRVAKTLQREAHGIDHRHSSSHQAVAQLDAQEILLRLRRAVTNRIKQSQIHSPNTRQHQRITLVTLALMLINRSHLARIGHHYPPAKCFQKSTDPRTMRSRLHHPERTVITTGQLLQRDSIVADAVLLDYFSPLIQRTKPVPAISQIQSYRNVTALGLLLHRRRAYLSAIAQTLFAFSSNLVRPRLIWNCVVQSTIWRGTRQSLSNPPMPSQTCRRSSCPCS